LHPRPLTFKMQRAIKGPSRNILLFIWSKSDHFVWRTEPRTDPHVWRSKTIPAARPVVATLCCIVYHIVIMLVVRTIISAVLEPICLSLQCMAVLSFICCLGFGYRSQCHWLTGETLLETICYMLTMSLTDGSCCCVKVTLLVVAAGRAPVGRVVNRPGDEPVCVCVCVCSVMRWSEICSLTCAMVTVSSHSSRYLHKNVSWVCRCQSSCTCSYAVFVTRTDRHVHTV